jgi:putative membrane protein
MDQAGTRIPHGAGEFLMMFDRDERDEPNLTKGLIAGVAGGLIASLVMEQFQAAWSLVGKKLQDTKPRSSGRAAKPTTVKAADAIARRVLGHKVRKKHQKLAGEAMHYVMGTGSAAVYGMLAEIAPAVTAGEGTAFGAVIWLAADEASLPALGLAKPPNRIPMSTHVYALASHLVYGAVTEAVRRALRKML